VIAGPDLHRAFLNACRVPGLTVANTCRREHPDVSSDPRSGKDPGPAVLVGWGCFQGRNGARKVRCLAVTNSLLLYEAS
jgi:hypothetical protein